MLTKEQNNNILSSHGCFGEWANSNTTRADKQIDLCSAKAKRNAARPLHRYCQYLL
jgi:hypothetical protein